MFLDLLEQMANVDVNNLEDGYTQSAKLDDGIYNNVTISDFRVAVKEEKGAIYYMVDYTLADGRLYTQFITLNAQSIKFNASRLLKLVRDNGINDIGTLEQLKIKLVQAPQSFVEETITYLIGKKGQLELKTSNKGFQNAEFIMFPF